MTGSPRVSICMPVFNGGRYFKAALESALAQEYDNLEIVVVNDGSTDAGETEGIALAYGDRVRYFCQANKGVAGAMNTAVDHMTGEFFAWLSHDDLHLPHKTAAQVAFLKRLGRPRACLFSDYDLIGPNDEPITSVRLPAERIRQNPRLPLYNGMINGCTLLIPAAILREFGPFDRALRCTQDYDVWNRILSQHEFFHQPEVLIRYRIHPGQGTNTPTAVSEGDVLWKSMLDSRNEIERTQMFGSTRHYFASLATFLDATPYGEAAAYAHSRAATSGADTMVSVVVPYRNNIARAIRAARTALEQTHRRVEVILVNHGSTGESAPLVKLAEAEPRLHVLPQVYDALAVALNAALDVVRGDYVAFLDPDDRLLPQKIEQQLNKMQEHGAVFSHSSHYVADPGRSQGFRTQHSGRFGGDCYPEIIGTNPIATSTVMLHRAVIDGGFTFPTDLCIGGEMLAWIDLAMRHTLLGIDEPLSIVEWPNARGPLDSAQEVLVLANLVEALQRHRVHRRHPREIETLRQSIRAISWDWVAAGRHIEAVKTQGRLGAARIAEFPASPVGTVWRAGADAA